MNPFTILSGDETLAAEITETSADVYTVRLIDAEARRDAGESAGDFVLGTFPGLNIDNAVRRANAWVTQTPFEPACQRPGERPGCECDLPAGHTGDHAGNWLTRRLRWS